MNDQNPADERSLGFTPTDRELLAVVHAIALCESAINLHLAQHDPQETIPRIKMSVLEADIQTSYAELMRDAEAYRKIQPLKGAKPS